MKRWVLVVVCACTTPVATDSLVKTSPARSADCPGGGVEIDSGPDTNHDHMLEPGEIDNTSFVCSPVAAPKQLVAVVAEPPGANCANGGEAIETGADANGNGVLDAGEVESTSYVCTGADGAAVLVRVDVEPAGANCAAGGSAVKVGHDANGDGVLEDAEVESTSFVCDGAAGETVLIRVDAEAPGANCEDGGSAIHVGLDANGDGVLEDSEIQQTSFLCGIVPLPTTIEGDVTIQNDLDVAQLAGVTQITGAVYIQGSTLTTIQLPNLVAVGDIDCLQEPDSEDGLHGPNGCSSVATLSLPHLTTVSGITGVFMDLEMPALTSLDMATIQHVGTFWTLFAPHLATLSLPKLTDGELLFGSSALSSMDVPNWISGAFEFGSPGGSPAPITTMSFPKFTSGEIDIGAVNVTTLSLPALTSFTQFFVGDAPSLTAIDLPLAGSGTRLFIERNPQLQTITAPNLTSVTTQFEIDTNPHLPTCLAQELATQANATNVTITGNDDAASCP